MNYNNVIRTLVVLLIITSLLQTLVFASSLGIEGFQYRSEQKVSLNKDALFFVLSLGPKVYEKIDPTLKDFRLEGNSSELGYALIPSDTILRTVNKKVQPLKALNIGEDHNGNYSFTLQLPLLNLEDTHILRIKLDHEPYLVKGSMYGSNDNRNWQKLSDITLFSTNNIQNELSLANIDYDYLKIDLKQPYEEKLSIKEAFLESFDNSMVTISSIVETVPIETILNDNSNKETIVELDLDYTNRITSEIVIDTIDKGFNRQLILEGSNTKENWNHIGATFIYQGIEDKDKSLGFKYKQSNYRYLRIRIIDQDNAPIHIQGIQVRTHPIQLLVKVPNTLQGQQELNLKAYWGNSTINYPNYDVGNFVTKIKLSDINHFTLDDYNENPNYIGESKPITEQYPFILPIALALTTILIGYILYRNVIQSK